MSLMLRLRRRSRVRPAEHWRGWQCLRYVPTMEHGLRRRSRRRRASRRWRPNCSARRCSRPGQATEYFGTTKMAPGLDAASRQLGRRLLPGRARRAERSAPGTTRLHRWERPVATPGDAHVEGVVLPTVPGDGIVFHERLLHASAGGTRRRQRRVDFVTDRPESESLLKAYFAAQYTPGWDGGYDPFAFPVTARLGSPSTRAGPGGWRSWACWRPPRLKKRSCVGGARARPKPEPYRRDDRRQPQRRVLLERAMGLGHALVGAFAPQR